MPKCIYCNREYKNLGFYYEKHIRNCYLRLKIIFKRNDLSYCNSFDKLSNKVMKFLDKLTKQELIDVRMFINIKNHYNYLKDKYPDFYELFINNFIDDKNEFK